MPSPSVDLPLVPARMLNEHAYCPRLAYLEWVQGDFAANEDVADGQFVHRRVDKEGGELPRPEAAKPEKLHARSVLLSAPKVGLVAKLDLIEGEDGWLVPVDYKRGEAPDVPEGAREPERVQLCAQGLVLEENGYRTDHGILYFAGSKQRVEVRFDGALRARTLALLSELRQRAASGAIPAPLIDSPKCPRCSLVGICLPDEINHLRLPQAPDADEGGVRKLLPARDDALPLYVQSAGARVSKQDEELIVTDRDGTKRSVKIVQTSQVSLHGGVQITTQTVAALCGRAIPICYFSSGGWFYGLTVGMTHKNVELRQLQFAAAADEKASLALARRLVEVKIKNCRTLLRRNSAEPPAQDLERLSELAAQAREANDAPSLLGFEGTAARLYFGHFGELIKASEENPAQLRFDFNGRNRRPPTDPVNALLSFAYSLLAKDMSVTLLAVGFDPFLGFYHRPRYGRPALALDLIEEFRPLIADSVVLSAINTGVVKSADFVERGGAVALGSAGRARFLGAYERRMDELVTHPVFGYRISYRRVLEVQARLLARHLSGEIPELPPFLTR
ncbi:MAG: CRISPR-associated endonuclease Cas4g/Cas1g [Myxococcales bacterium]